MKRCVPLEPAAEEVCDKSSVAPLIFELPPRKGRKILEEAQNTDVYKYPADISSTDIDTGNRGIIPVYFVSPKGRSPKKIIFYIHGGGWVFGSFHTHEKLVRELAARTDSLVVFPEYTLSPEAKYPVALEQCYFVFSHIREFAGRCFRDIGDCELIVAGDSVGGNMAIATVLMSNGLCTHGISKLLLYYPVTNAYFDTPSYNEFAVNYYLYRNEMKWFWRQYTGNAEDKCEITASPLRASLKCLRGFPPTMIINGQADVLCSEGEAFADNLRCAGVDVTALRIRGIIHDFVMLNSLDRTSACRIAMDASTAWLNR